MKTYKPKPIDTSGVVLPDEILELTEKIAENVHEVYAAGRIAEGWRYGPERDDRKKTNPTLVNSRMNFLRTAWKKQKITMAPLP